MQLNCIYIYCIYNINNFKFKFKRFEELSVDEFSVERWRLRFFSRFIMLNRMLRLYSLYRTSSTGRHQLLALSGHGTQTWGFANPGRHFFHLWLFIFAFQCGLAYAAAFLPSQASASECVFTRTTKSAHVASGRTDSGRTDVE